MRAQDEAAMSMIFLILSLSKGAENHPARAFAILIKTEKGAAWAPFYVPM
jgi:hypothetical protein